MESASLRITTAVAEVDVHDLCISVAGRDLLKDAHLKLCAGQRYGFVGRNGSGKSTLFRSMASGRIPGYPANCVTLLVDQEDVGDERTAVDTVSRPSFHSLFILCETLELFITIFLFLVGLGMQNARPTESPIDS